MSAAYADEPSSGVVALSKTYWTASELLAADFPEPRWAVPGVVAEGLTLFVGQPKVGKSWLGLNLAVAVATGGQALGKVNVDAGDVLYLALEDNPRRLADRLRKILGKAGAPPRLAFDTAWPTLANGGAERLDRWLTAKPDARLVIVDVFARIRGATSSNVSGYDVDYLAMSRLKNLADQHNVAVLVIHHTRKMADSDFLNEVSGTNGLAGAADAVAVLKRSRGKADAELHITGRDVDEAQYALTFTAKTGTWQMLDGPAGDYGLSDTRLRILTWLRENGGAGTPKEVATGLGEDPKTIKQRCWRMRQDGQLDSTNGRYTPNNRRKPHNPQGDLGYEGYDGYDE